MCSSLSDVDSRPWDFQAEECALRAAVDRFNYRRYRLIQSPYTTVHVQSRSKRFILGSENGLDVMFRRNMCFSCVAEHFTTSFLEPVKNFFDRLWRTASNCIMEYYRYDKGPAPSAANQSNSSNAGQQNV